MMPARAPTELSRVDAGIAHLSQIAHLFLPSNGNDAAPSPLRSLNLHGNRLVRLEPAALLARLACLTALDVSSNDLVDMAAVASLPMLRVLNLANNRLTTIQGLDALVHLEKLVLAHNAISSLVGLVHIHGAGYALKTLDVRGNRIADVPELYYLSGLVNLQSLAIADNPVMTTSNARSTLWSLSRSLTALDGVDRHGQPVRAAHTDWSFLVAPPPAALSLIPGPTASVPILGPWPAQPHQSSPPAAQPVPPLPRSQAPTLQPSAAPAPPLAPAPHPPVPDPAIEKLQATVAHLVQAVEHRADDSAVHDELRALKLHVAKMEHKHAKLAKRQQQQQQQPQQQDLSVEPSSRATSTVTPALQDLVQFELEVRRLQTAEAEHARQIRALMAELDAERARNAKLDKTKSAFEEQMHVARTTSEALEIRAKEAEGRAETAQRQASAWQRRAAALEAKGVKVAKRWGKERDMYRTKLMEAKDQIMELRGAVQDLARDLTGMRDQVHAQEAAFQSKLSDAIQKRTEQAHQTETHLSQSHAAALHDLQTQLAAARQAQAAAEAQAAQALAHATARTQTLEADAARAAARAEAAESATRTVESQLQQSRAELENRTHERDEALRVVATQRTQLRALAVQVRDLEHLYEAKVTKYRAKVASVVPALKGEVDRLTKEVEVKSTELAAAQEKVAELQAAVKTAEERASKAGTQLERVRKEVDALKPAVAVKDKMLADQAESIKQVKAHLAAKVAEFQDVQRKLEGLKELEYELQRRDADIDRLEDLADAYRAERNDARELAADLQQRLDDRNTAIQHIEAEAAKVQAQIAKAEADARSAVAARDLVVDELKRVVEASRHAQTEAEHARDAALSQAAELRDAVHEMQAQCEAVVHDRDVAVRKVRTQYADLERKWRQVSAAFGSALGVLPGAVAAAAALGDGLNDHEDNDARYEPQHARVVRQDRFVGRAAVEVKQVPTLAKPRSVSDPTSKTVSASRLPLPHWRNFGGPQGRSGPAAADAEYVAVSDEDWG